MPPIDVIAINLSGAKINGYTGIISIVVTTMFTHYRKYICLSGYPLIRTSIAMWQELSYSWDAGKIKVYYASWRHDLFDTQGITINFTKL